MSENKQQEAPASTAPFTFQDGQIGLAGFQVCLPKYAGFYVMGDAVLGHKFCLTRKPSRIERFFVRRLLGLSWMDMP